MSLALNEALADRGVTERRTPRGKVLSAIRVALTGTTKGADLLGTMALLGPRCAARRLARAAESGFAEGGP